MARNHSKVGEYYGVDADSVGTITAGTDGASATSIATKVGTTVADASVNSSAKLFSVRTGLTGSEVEYLYISKQKSHFLNGEATEIATFENNDSSVQGFIRVRGGGDFSDGVLGSNDGAGYVGTTTATFFNIITDAQTRVTIDDIGRVGISTSLPSYSLDVSGSTRSTVLQGTGNRAVYSDANGVLTNTSSDLSLKQNIFSLSYGLKEILLLNPISFDWKEKERFGAQREIGFIAQEVKEIIPEIVGVNNDGTLSLDYSKIVSVLTNAVKELKKQNDELNNKLEFLYNEIKTLQNK